MINFIPHFIFHVITYPCYDKVQFMLVKRAAGQKERRYKQLQPTLRFDENFNGVMGAHEIWIKIH